MGNKVSFIFDDVTIDKLIIQMRGQNENIFTIVDVSLRFLYE